MISQQLPKDMGEKFKQQIRLVILLVAGMAIGRSANAEIIGADLGYEVSGNTLYVNLTVFDNFNGITDVNRYVDIKSATSSTSISSYLTLVSQSDVSPVCKSACTKYKQTSCDNDFTIVQTVYRAKVNLSNFASGDCDLVMSWVQRGRISSEESFYLAAEVNKCTEDGNSSPTIINAPYPFAHFNEAYSYSWQATDTDGDSLVYRLIESRHSEVSSYSYAKGLSHASPLQFLGHPSLGGTFPKGFHFDSRYGQLQFHPTKIMSAPLCVVIEEYRNGEKIGESTRDLMFDVINNSNEKPVVTGINGTNKSIVTACVGQEICFQIETEDLDLQSALELSWRTDALGAKISKTASKKPTLDFCWTPTQKDLGRKDFYLFVKASDGACNLDGIYERLIAIEVVKPFEASFTAKNQNCNEVSFKASTNDGNAKRYTYDWKVFEGGYSGRSIKVRGSASGDFEATVEVKDNVSGCKGSYTGSFTIPVPEQVSGGADQVLCPGDEVTFTAKGGKEFTWFDKNREELSKGENFKLPLTETSTFVVRSVDEFGCVTSDSVVATVRETELKAIAPTLSVCVGSKVEIKVDGGQDVTWSNFGFVGGDDEKATYVFKNDATVKIKGVDINGCNATASTKVVMDTDCVLPGDVNGDGWVNNEDVLGVGLAFHQEHPAPSSFTPADQISTQPLKSNDWGLTFKETNRDIKHADANQSGMVEASDAMVIDRHYATNYSGFITSKKKGTGVPITFSDSIIKVEDNDTTFELELFLGSKDKPAKDVYGISFSIAYNGYVSSSSIEFNTDNSWLKADKSTTIQVVKNIRNKGTGGGGEIQIGFSRTNKQAITGGGSIGKLTFVVDDDNIGWVDDENSDKVLNFQIKSITMVNNEGDPINAYGEFLSIHYWELYGMKQKIEVFKPKFNASIEHNSDDSEEEPEGLQLEFENISVFPNPTGSGTVFYTVPVGMSNVQVSISDLSGKTVLEKFSSITGVNTIDVSTLKGYYILTFEGSQGAKVIPIIIN